MHLSTRYMLPIVLLLLIVTGSPGLGGDHPFRTTIRGIYGGTTRLDTITSMEFTGTVTDTLPHREGPFRLTVTTGKRLRVEKFVTLSSSGEIRIIGTGGKGWRNDRTDFVPLSPSEVREIFPEWFVFLFPVSLLNEGGELSYDDLVIKGGRPYELYRVKRNDMPEVTLSSDPVSRLVTFIEWHDTRDAHITWEMGDFRFVDGVILPFSFTRRVDDIVVQTIRVGSITLNRSIPPGTFAP